MYKVKLGIAPKFMADIFTKRSIFRQHYARETKKPI